jgi:hypothetical protein
MKNKTKYCNVMVRRDLCLAQGSALVGALVM